MRCTVPPFATGNMPDTSDVRLIVEEPVLVKALPVVFKNPADNESIPFKKPSIVVVILKLSTTEPPEDTITLLFTSAVELLVPPLLIETTGRSTFCKYLKTGRPDEEPDGDAKTRFGAFDAKFNVILPLLVIGLLPIENISLEVVRPTDVTLPVLLLSVAITSSNVVQLAST